MILVLNESSLEGQKMAVGTMETSFEIYTACLCDKFVQTHGNAGNCHVLRLALACRRENGQSEILLEKEVAKYRSDSRYSR